MDNRIAVISYGMVSAIGGNAEESWRGLIKEKIGLKKLPKHISYLVRSKNAHLIDMPYVEDRLLKITIKAADEAMSKVRDIKIDAICLGSSSAGFAEIEREILNNQSVTSGLLKPKSLVRRLAKYYSIDSKRAIQCSQACASSAYAIAIGADMIKYKSAEIVLAGGADEITASVIAGFESIRIHAEVCRPFDENRRGLVLGEGAAFVILCSARFASSLNLPILAYVDGVGLTCDAHHMSSPDPSGRQVIHAIMKSTSQLKEQNIDFICAHGTGTRYNDLTESIILTHVFGKPVPPTSSYKGSLGHPQGASGACGVVLSILAMQNNILFPTVGLENQDKSILLDIVRETRRERVERALCLSYGSWGANAALIISKS